MKYRIRRARSQNDWDTMKRMEREYFTAWTAPPQWDRPNSHWWVVVTDSGKIVGYAGGHLDGDRMFYLSSSAISTEHQGRGLQKRLIRVRLQQAKRLGALGCYTCTYKNPASNNSLIACGFKSVLPNWYYCSDDSHYWRRMFRKKADKYE